MKTKQPNNLYITTQNNNKTLYHKQRNNNHYKKNYHQSYKNNNSNGYYDKSYSWKENFEYSEHPNYTMENNRNYYKKNNWYNNNNNQYKKYNETYDDEDVFAYISNNSRNNNKYNNNKSNDNSISNTNTSTNIVNSSEQNVIKGKEEVLKVKINLKNEIKEIIIYKNDDTNAIAEQFCKDNQIDSKLGKPLGEKLKRSLDSIQVLVNNNLCDKDIKLLKNIKELYTKDKSPE